MDVKGAYAHLEFVIPARGLLGLRNRLMSGTQGEAIMHHNFHDYQPFRGEIPRRANGVMVSMVHGPAVAFALDIAPAARDDVRPARRRRLHRA